MALNPLLRHFVLKSKVTKAEEGFAQARKELVDSELAFNEARRIELFAELELSVARMELAEEVERLSGVSRAERNPVLDMLDRIGV